jgi:hypothetical protein
MKNGHVKEVPVETAEHTVGYQPKLDNRRWFDEECKTAVDEKNAGYNKWIDIPTTSKRLEYKRLQKILVACKRSKYKKSIQTDNCMKKIEENVKEEKHIRNASKGVDLLKVGFKPYANLYKVLLTII